MSRERTGFAVGTDAAAAETPAERMPSELTVKLGDKSIIMKGLNQINLIFGKNGCGKSRLLHAIQDELKKDKRYAVNFIKSERGEKSMLQGELATDDEDSMILGRPGRVYYEAEAKKMSFRGGVFYTYNSEHLRTITEFLDNVEVFVEDRVPNEVIGETWFEMSPDERLKLSFWTKDSKRKKLDIKDLSDGEIEIIYIVSHLIKFFDQISSAPSGKNYIILIDEVDVRLHPDVQYKIANFILKQIEKIAPELNLKIFITTHSTSILSALAESPKASVCFMRPGSHLVFEALSSPVSSVMQDILPVFGAHPLSQVFNERPPVLVEGLDEEWIFNLLVRNKTVKVYPCQTGSVDNMPQYIVMVNKILYSLYDHPRAFAIRDRDRDPAKKKAWYASIDDLLAKSGIVENLVNIFELQCYAIENLCFTDEFLEFWGIKWEDLAGLGKFFARTDRGRDKNCKSEQSQLMAYLYKCENDKEARGEKNIKRMPWQEAVVKVISKAVGRMRTPSGEFSEHSIISYLGEGIITHLFNVPLAPSAKPSAAYSSALFASPPESAAIAEADSAALPPPTLCGAGNR